MSIYFNGNVIPLSQANKKMVHTIDSGGKEGPK